MPAEQRIFADPAAMADEHEIIQFGALADERLADGGAVDAGIGLDLYVVADHSDSRLRHFVPAAVALFGETEAIAADDHAVLQHHAIANAAAFAHDGMRVREKVVANARAAIDGDEAVQDGVTPEHGVFVDVAVRANVRAFSDLC